MKLSHLIAAAVCLFTGSISVFSADVTQQDAIAMVTKAAKFFAENGKEKAFAAYQDKSGEFVKGELYVFVYDFTGTCLAHGSKPKLVGTNRLDVEDVNGKKYIQEIIAQAKTKGSGWVDYMFQNPETKAIEPKSTYSARLGTDDMFVACGIYRK